MIEKERKREKERETEKRERERPNPREGPQGRMQSRGGARESPNRREGCKAGKGLERAPTPGRDARQGRGSREPQPKGGMQGREGARESPNPTQMLDGSPSEILIKCWTGGRPKF